TVDHTLQDRHVVRPAGEIGEEARDLLAAFDRMGGGADEATAIADGRGVGVEETDEGVDVLGLPCLLEGPDDTGALGCRSRGSLGLADATAGRRGQFATRRRRTADD